MSNETQKVLFSGLDCFHGKMDLFETDGTLDVATPPAKDNSNVWVISADGSHAWKWNEHTRVEFVNEAEANVFAKRDGLHIVDDRFATGPTNVWD